MATALCVSGYQNLAYGQDSLTKIRQETQNLARQYAEVDAMLADTDKNKRIGAMVALIKSDDPIFQKRAREVGLFSPDPEMRMLALQATLNSGGPFRIDVALQGADEKQTFMQKWIERVHGSRSADGAFAQYIFSTSSYNSEAQCWQMRGDRNCVIKRAGETLSFNWGAGYASFTLSTDGRLIGSIRYSFNSFKGIAVPAQINLIR